MGGAVLWSAVACSLVCSAPLRAILCCALRHVPPRDGLSVTTLGLALAQVSVPAQPRLLQPPACAGVVPRGEPVVGLGVALCEQAAAVHAARRRHHLRASGLGPRRSQRAEHCRGTHAHARAHTLTLSQWRAPPPPRLHRNRQARSPAFSSVFHIYFAPAGCDGVHVIHAALLSRHSCLSK